MSAVLDTEVNRTAVFMEGNLNSRRLRNTFSEISKRAITLIRDANWPRTGDRRLYDFTQLPVHTGNGRAPFVCRIKVDVRCARVQGIG